jgi:hypothetical protein
MDAICLSKAQGVGTVTSPTIASTVHGRVHHLALRACLCRRNCASSCLSRIIWERHSSCVVCESNLRGNPSSSTAYCARLKATQRHGLMCARTIFWDITQCNPLKVIRRFGGTYRLHLHGGIIRQARNERESKVACRGPLILGYNAV